MKTSIMCLVMMTMMTVAMAQDKAKVAPPSPAPATPTKAVVPTIPAEYMPRLQSIEIQQMNLKSDMKKLVDQYQADSNKMGKLAESGKSLSSEMFKKLGLDETKYQIITTEDGYLEIQEKTSATKDGK
jgi:hypothetical protein